VKTDAVRRLEVAVEEVRTRIAEAALGAGRDPADVRLIAVTKGVPPDRVADAARAGLTEFGENYVQQMEAKRAAAPDATWHFVGRLQRNKARRVLELADVVQSIEPGAAAERLARLAREGDRQVDCLLEVDFTEGRVGATPEDVEPSVQRLASLGGLRVTGLMTVAPLGGDPRPAFAALRELRDRLREGFSEVRELSMGMSSDLEAAVEEGATMVRVGTAIFGPREVDARRR
jgi:pyridoxal phosphate enzyme (YggS family)